MVEIVEAMRIVKQDRKATKLIREIMAVNISEVKPTTNRATKEGFGYPLAEGVLESTTKEALATLEFLANEEILERHFHENILFCSQCQSPSLKPGPACPKCSSGNIAKGRILEHFPCLYNGLEEDYTNNGKYTCPKCKQELRFLGTDYQSLGINYKCRECGGISKEAAVNLQCLQCSVFFPESEAKKTILYSYHLNEDKKRQLEFEFGEKPRFADFLSNRGYEVAENAKVESTTKSGAKHVLDILAQRSDGLITHTLGIGILVDGQGREVSLADVFAFDNKVYDLGIHDKVLLVEPKLNPEANQFARLQRINVLEKKDLKSILDAPSPSLQKQSNCSPFIFETKAKLLEHLKNSGYRFEEKAKILGRSGVEHTFDILAVNNDGIINHTLGINILIAQDEVSFNEVSSFDSRAYDVGIHDKLLLACPRLSREAKQFAQYQRIKVIEVNDLAKLV